ncbi:hypothetical protein AXG93_2852s1050 [Marchantia polymorpha subsp. ruderalis]|uniref:Uncharacterized protein n=1 Tax=Marchantia polymorpha subsp. ruderalis TaxID=1480154 RepID=A0A176WMA5_MARPO|nr:hypothetical protein AXG93_2852s1050 [Marchantia polymorpha subsp. ruderalis]
MDGIDGCCFGQVGAFFWHRLLLAAKVQQSHISHRIAEAGGEQRSQIYREIIETCGPSSAGPRSQEQEQEERDARPDLLIRPSDPQARGAAVVERGRATGICAALSSCSSCSSCSSSFGLESESESARVRKPPPFEVAVADLDRINPFALHSSSQAYTPIIASPPGLHLHLHLSSPSFLSSWPSLATLHYTRARGHGAEMNTIVSVSQTMLDDDDGDERASELRSSQGPNSNFMQRVESGRLVRRSDQGPGGKGGREFGEWGDVAMQQQEGRALSNEARALEQRGPRLQKIRRAGFSALARGLHVAKTGPAPLALS